MVARFAFTQEQMSFDLYFCRRDGSAPAIAELKQYFAALPLFKIEDIDAGGVQFWYQNEATGVYCSFSYSPIDAQELEGCGSSGLSFNLNFNRPSFFAYETMPLVEAFCNYFDLVVEDSQEETVQPAQAERFDRFVACAQRLGDGRAGQISESGGYGTALSSRAAGNGVVALHECETRDRRLFDRRYLRTIVDDSEGSCAATVHNDGLARRNRSILPAL